MAEGKKLRIGILGSGYMGLTYSECLTKYNSRCELVAISGGSRAPGLASKHSVEYVESPESLIRRSDIDAVVITTPPGNHPENVISAAENGKHAMVEKPMAPDPKQCNEMIRAADKAGVYLEVLQTQRWRSTNAAAKKAILEGKLGKIRMIRGTSLFLSYEGGGAWTRDPAHGGPNLDLNVHGMDMIRYLSGGEPTVVFGQMKTFGDAPYPNLSAMIQLKFDNGVQATHWSSQEMPEPSMPNSMFGFIVVGENSMLDIDAYGKTRISNGSNEWILLDEFPKVDYINRPLDPKRLQPFIAAMQSFIDDVLDSRPPTVTGQDGKIAVEMVRASEISNESGQAVKLPLI
jgi:UDP-N-acetyl-2-amino-2-deoxyglucuronate dehydrogenase